MPSSSSNALDALTGSVIADKYRLTEVLGSGGMGTVYLAEQLGLGRTVAIKLLRTVDGDELVETFRREALAASRINHPHAVAVYDFGVHAGTPYLVMEHLRGQTLAQLIQEEPVAAERAVLIATQVLSALHEAHACGVVHCDLSSENIIVENLRSGDDFAKVIDFGLARAVPIDGRVVGTAEYMAPERIRDGIADRSCDIYAAGILLYEMLVGRTPFAGASDQVVLEGHLNAEPAPPHAIVPGCPQALSRVVLRALAKDPASRQPDAATLRREILDSMDRAVESPPTAEATIRQERDVDPSRTTQPLDGAYPRTASRVLSEFHAQSTPFVGRTEEAKRLVALAEGVRSPYVVVVSGPTGVGKARLCAEVARGLERVPFFVAGADPSGLRTSWHPILSILQQILKLAGSPTYEQLSVAVARCGLPERDAPGLAEVFGIEGPSAHLELAVRRRESVAASVRSILAIKRLYPRAVLCFGDVDDYDTPSLEILGEVTQQAAERALRVLVTTRGETPIRADVSEQIHLSGLSPEDSHTLLLQHAPSCANPPTPDEVYELTGGLPAAIVQLGAWLDSGRSLADAPGHLVDLVSIRFNRLPSTARRILQSVAVHGSVASRWLVEEVLTDREVDALDNADFGGLLRVTHELVIIPDPMIASIVDACTPADVRRSLHEQALRALDGEGPHAVRGHHAEHCGDSSAFQLYMDAGDDAVRRFDDLGATVWYRRAAAIARARAETGDEVSARQYVDARCLLGEVLRCLGDSEAESVTEEALACDPDRRQKALLLRTRGLLRGRAGRDEESVRDLEEACKLAIAADEKNLACQCLLDLAGARDAQGKRDDATHELEAGLDLISKGQGFGAPEIPDRLWRVGMVLAERHLRAGDADLAKKTALGAHSLANRVQNAHASGRISALLARICEALGEYGVALRHRANAIDELRNLGDRRSTAELLIETARAADKAAGGEGPSRSSRTSLRLAGKLAAEIGWEQGVALTQTRATK